ncbi:MAG: hypothetical protein IJQ39_09400 [Thermoguttaceae bacterium]|nr:hypothetical protein [Thermoguttaceae bacterium]
MGSISRMAWLSRYNISRRTVCTSEEFVQLFPPERFPMEDLPADEALSNVKDCDIEYQEDMLRPGCSYKKYQSPFKKQSYGKIWEIVAEFPSDENERIHVWFVYY